jgi:two-component system sensor histidine kinase CiaH
VYVDPHLRVVHADGALGEILLDRQNVRQALRTNQSQCCSVETYQGQDYLVYTNPLRSGGKVVGVAQTSISEHQYDQTMQSLQLVLLIATLLGLAGSSGISAVLVQRALQPIRLSLQRQRDFVADAAHELRTPLAIMRTVGEVGLNGPEDEDQQATIEQMLAENRHLTRLVDDLSLLARADSQAIALDRRPTDLSALVTETVSELGPLAEAQHVVLTVEAPGNIRVMGDILRLRQLLLILLDNALKHTPSGGRVRVRLSAQGGRARLQVADFGPGIDPADLPHIFDRFYRADRARTGEGSGLGLAIGKWIVEAHGGQIQAGNALEHGAVFTVTLPLARAVVAP